MRPLRLGGEHLKTHRQDEKNAKDAKGVSISKRRQIAGIARTPHAPGRTQAHEMSAFRLGARSALECGAMAPL